jgi:hypothetical protein
MWYNVQRKANEDLEGEDYVFQMRSVGIEKSHGIEDTL